jgi:arsenate reductase
VVFVSVEAAGSLLESDGSELCMIYNPKCSKCRRTLEILQEHDVSPVLIEYLDNPPSVEMLDDICCKLGVEPIDIIRIKESRFTELGLDVSDSRSRKEWFEIMISNPVLIERPIFCCNGRAAVGRPPESVLEIL